MTKNSPVDEPEGFKWCFHHGELHPLDDFFAKNRRLDRNGQPYRTCKEAQRERAAKHVDTRVEWQRVNRPALRMKRHGITVDDFREMWSAQAGRCPVCQVSGPTPDDDFATSREGGYSWWAVDHDHGCCPDRKSCGNCVRGLLCRFCNVGIGSLRDDPARLIAAAEYLQKYAASQSEAEHEVL